MAPQCKSPDGENTKPKRKRRHVSTNDPDYKEKRDRNNVAVKKSREQTREKTKQTLERVAQLRTENQQLTMKVQLLAKELDVLKDLFRSASPKNFDQGPAQSLEAAMQTEEDSDLDQFVVPIHIEPQEPSVEVNHMALTKDHGYATAISP